MYIKDSTMICIHSSCTEVSMQRILYREGVKEFDFIKFTELKQIKMSPYLS